MKSNDSIPLKKEEQVTTNKKLTQDYIARYENGKTIDFLGKMSRYDKIQIEHITKIRRKQEYEQIYDFLVQGIAKQQV